MTQKTIAYISVNEALKTPYDLYSITLNDYFKLGKEFGYKVVQYFDGSHKQGQCEIRFLEDTRCGYLKGKHIYRRLPVFHNLKELREFTKGRLVYDDGRPERMRELFQAGISDIPVETLGDIFEDAQELGIPEKFISAFLIRQMGYSLLGETFKCNDIKTL